MKRMMKLEEECKYIWQNYGRYELDCVTCETCMEILHWMEEKEEFSNLIYAGACQLKGQNYGEKIGVKGKEKLRERLFKDQRIRHRRKTLDRCLTFLLKDIYIFQ